MGCILSSCIPNRPVLGLPQSASEGECAPFMYWMGQRRTPRREDEAKMKKRLLMACAVTCMLFGVQAASSIQLGDYTYYYNLNPDRTTVDLYQDHVPGLAWWIYRQAIDPSPVGELIIPEEIAINPSNRYAVVNLGPESFKQLVNMTSVIIPNTVTNIGTLAFRNCSSLTNVQFSSTLQSIGTRTFMSCHSLEEVVLPQAVVSLGQSVFGGCKSLKSIQFPDGLLSIGDSAFSHPGMAYEENVACTNLTSIVIPSTVTNIGSYAFYDCKGLRGATICGGAIGQGAFSDCIVLSDVTLGENVTSIGESAFSGCTNLTELAVPDSVTSIGASAFKDCTKLTRITLGNGVKSIGNYAFQGCTNLTEIIIPDSVTMIGDYTFQGCCNARITWGKNIFQMGRYAFAQCAALREVVLDRTAFIGDYAFSQCTSLERVVLSERARRLGTHAFERCSSLEVVEIGGGDIGESAFYYCPKLRVVTLGDKVTSVGRSAFASQKALATLTLGSSVITNFMDYAFYDTSITSVTLPESIQSVGQYAFARTPIYEAVIPSTVQCLNATFQYCTNLTNVVFHTDVTYDSGEPVLIGVRELIDTFSGCTALATITIPDTVTNNMIGAFYGCGLKHIDLPQGLLNIGNSTFRDCHELTEVVIPDSVTNIGAQAFMYCWNMTNVTMGANVRTIGSQAFANCYRLKGVTLPSNLSLIGYSAFYYCDGIEEIVIPNGVTIEGSAFENCRAVTNVTLGSNVTYTRYAFRNCTQLKKITALGTMPSGDTNYLPGVKKYVVTEEHLASWLPWLIQNNQTCAILDESTHEEIRVAVGNGGATAVGIMSALGVSPARSTDASGAVATYAMPEVSIDSFDPASGRVDVKVTPADGGAVSDTPVTSCIVVKGSDDLSAWETVATSVVTDGYQQSGTFSCTFDPTAHRFFKVSVAPCWSR